MNSILLVHVPYMFNTNPPMAAPLLKACLSQHGIKSKALDLNIEFIKSSVSTDSIIAWMQRPDIKPKVDEWKNYKNWIFSRAKEIAESDFNYIGISVFTKDSQRAAEDLILCIREINPNKKIIIGGYGVNVYQSYWRCFWYELMYDSGLVDVVVLGEGEKTLVDVIHNNKVGIIKSKQLTSQELDFIPIPDFSDYNLKNYVSDLDDNETFAIPITGSKGCVRDCTFCDVGKFWEKFYARSGENVAKEIINFYQKYNFKYFRFTDSLINGNVKEFRLMNRKLSEEIPFKIKYQGQFICRPQNQMPLDDFKLMARAGAHRVQIGIESGSENVRSHMRKKFSNKDIEYCTYQLFENNIKQSWFIFVGYPNETEEDFAQTIELITKFKDLAKDKMLQIIPTGVFQILDGTPISSQEMLDDLGIYQHNLNGYETYNWISTKYPENTLKIRAERFRKLVKVCQDLDFLNGYESLVEGHMKMINSQSE